MLATLVNMNASSVVFICDFQLTSDIEYLSSYIVVVHFNLLFGKLLCRNTCSGSFLILKFVICYELEAFFVCSRYNTLSDIWLAYFHLYIYSVGCLFFLGHIFFSFLMVSCGSNPKPGTYFANALSLN